MRIWIIIKKNIIIITWSKLVNYLGIEYLNSMTITINTNVLSKTGNLKITKFEKNYRGLVIKITRLIHLLCINIFIYIFNLIFY